MCSGLEVEMEFGEVKIRVWFEWVFEDGIFVDETNEVTATRNNDALYSRWTPRVYYNIWLWTLHNKPLIEGMCGVVSPVLVARFRLFEIYDYDCGKLDAKATKYYYGTIRHKDRTKLHRVSY